MLRVDFTMHCQDVPGYRTGNPEEYRPHECLVHDSTACSDQRTRGLCIGIKTKYLPSHGIDADRALSWNPQVDVRWGFNQWLEDIIISRRITTVPTIIPLVIISPCIIVESPEVPQSRQATEQ